jgi:hypothetical protein
MRKIIVTVALFALTLINLNAQTVESEESKESKRPEINTLIGSGETFHSGYGGLHMKITDMNGQTGMMMGGRGGWLINGKFTLGLAGYGLVSGRDITYTDKDDKVINTKNNIGYGGLYLEYIHEPVSLIHFTGNVLLGFGGSSFQDIDYYHSGNNQGDDFEKHPWAAYYVIEPTVSVEMNITSFMRVGVTASYRYMEEFESNQLYQDSQELRDSKMSGFNGGLYLVFGGF